MDKVNEKIWKIFRIRKGDNLPYKAWDGTRDRLGVLFRELGYTKGAEIGVLKGKFSERLLIQNDKLHLLCIDPWVPYGAGADHIMEECYEESCKRLAGMNSTIIRKKSTDAAKFVQNDSLDFVYIDGGHDFDNVIMDLLTWIPKVRRGGIISGHDYSFGHGYGVVQAVDAYTRCHNILMWYLTKDAVPSWLWVK